MQVLNRLKIEDETDFVRICFIFTFNEAPGLTHIVRIAVLRRLSPAWGGKAHAGEKR